MSNQNQSISDATLALILAAVNNLSLNSTAGNPMPTAGNPTRTAGNPTPATAGSVASTAGDQLSPSGTNTREGTVITLSGLVAALHILGVNVISPMEEMLHDEQIEACQQAQAASLERAVVGNTARTSSPWVVSTMANGPTVSAAPDATNVQVSGPSADAESINDGASATAEDVATTEIVASLPDAPPTSPVLMASAPALPASQNGVAADASAGTGATTGFLCSGCQSYQHRPAGPYYAVIAGRAVGVFAGWHNAMPLVSGVPHACFKRYSTEAEANAAFEEARRAGYVVVLA